MKLLLTSAGITTKAIATALQKLVGNGNPKVAFITTAANVEPGNKDWYVAQITNLQKYGYDWIDVIDPSAPGVNWRERLAEVGIVFVSGGNTFHLLDQTRKTGFDAWLKNHIEDIVYVGASAGSILVTPTIGASNDENLADVQNMHGLNLVDFEVKPHANTAKTNAKDYAQTRPGKLIAINDQSAIVVQNNHYELVAAGQYWEFS